MIHSTSLFLYYLIQWKPFTARVDLILNILSTAVLVVLYFFSLIFSTHSSAHFRDNLGFIFIIIVLALFGVNVLTILVYKSVMCIKACKDKKKKREFEQRLKKFEARTHTEEKLRDMNDSMETKELNWGPALPNSLPVFDAIQRKVALSFAEATK